MKRILITGGCGFVGSTLASYLKNKDSRIEVVALDNFWRKGSELNAIRLREQGIEIIQGDVRFPEDFEKAGDCDCVIDCAAEPSVLAGSDNPKYLIDTNLIGTVNALEYARKRKSVFVFLSTSRIYPIEHLNALLFREKESRYELVDEQKEKEVSNRGVTERFRIDGSRTLYGATKISAEHFVKEYASTFGLKAVINRCGVIAGPWQFGKVDQGVIALWVARHYFKKPLRYIGFGGNGKQVRDFMHADDVCEAIQFELENIDSITGETYILSGSSPMSVSLKELSAVCRDITGNRVEISPVPENRSGDIRIFLGDHAKFTGVSRWRPRKDIKVVCGDIFSWIKGNEHILKTIFVD